MADQHHPDYLAAPPTRRYSGGSLKLLFQLLWHDMQHLAPALRARGAWRILPGGALVTMSEAEDGRRVIRIARSEAPQSADGPARFRSECETFLRHFQASDWIPEQEEHETGIAMRFREPGTRRCRCGASLPVNVLLVDGEDCADCAVGRVREGAR